MKQFLTTMLAILLLLPTVTLTAMTMSAFTPIVTYQEVPETYQKLYQKKMAGKRQKIYTEGMITLDEAIKRARTKKTTIPKEVEKLLNVTIKLEYDKNTESPYHVAFAFDATKSTVPDSYDLAIFDEESSAYEFNLLPGSYNFYFTVDSEEIILLTAEDINVEEGMIINLSTTEATNEISFKTLNPQGEPIFDNIYDEDWENVILPGNVEEMSMNSNLNIIYKDVYSN